MKIEKLSIATILTKEGGFNVIWTANSEFACVSNETSHPAQANAEIVSAPAKLAVDIESETSNLCRIINTEDFVKNPESLYSLSRECDREERVLAIQVSRYYEMPIGNLKDFIEDTKERYQQLYG